MRSQTDCDRFFIALPVALYVLVSNLVSQCNSFVEALTDPS
ncbi:hypothetical protein [Moorena sp. SIO3I6]|nr:hypothetical protein [Moorena sp. SIO3I6]